MAQVTPPNNTVLFLDTKEAIEFLLEPTVNYANPLQDMTGFIHTEFGKDKLVMNHLNKPRFNLQPKSDCKTWNPTVRNGMRSDTIVVTDYETNGEQCNDEWDRSCARNMQGSQDDKLYADKNVQLTPLQQAMITTLRQSLVDDVYRTLWFSDTTFGTGSYAYSADLDLPNAGLSPEERVNLTTMMTQQNGIWREIQSYVSDGQIRYVDTNDGTASGNALDPANIADFLKELKRQAPSKLRLFGRGPGSTIMGRPMYLLQTGLFEAFKTYLTSLGTEESHRLIVEGIAVEGMYRFDGHLVMEIPEWSMWDSEIGMDSTAHSYSKVQRAIFTVPGNVTALINAKSLPGFEGSGLIIQTSQQIRDKGATWMYYAIGMGMSIAHQDLLVVGYNTELTTWNFSATYNSAFSAGAILP